MRCQPLRRALAVTDKSTHGGSMSKKRSEEDNTRTTGSAVGGAILGASLGGPVGAIIGGLFGAILGESVNDSKKANKGKPSDQKSPEGDKRG